MQYRFAPGAAVECTDGDLGDLVDVVTNEWGDVTHIVVRSWDEPATVVIPVGLVSDADGGRVQVEATREEARRLPHQTLPPTESTRGGDVTRQETRPEPPHPEERAEREQGRD